MNNKYDNHALDQAQRDDIHSAAQKIAFMKKEDGSMKKGWLSFTVLVYLILVAFSTWLLISPPGVQAATCTASCAGGRSVTCTGDSCTANDGHGCSSSVHVGGNPITTETLCPGKKRAPIGE